MMSNVAKSFDIVATNLSVLHNYSDSPTKLFSDLYSVKFLNASAKPFFPYNFVFETAKSKIGNNYMEYVN